MALEAPMEAVVIFRDNRQNPECENLTIRSPNLPLDEANYMADFIVRKYVEGKDGIPEVFGYSVAIQRATMPAKINQDFTSWDILTNKSWYV